MTLSPQLSASKQGLAALRLRMGDGSQPLGFLVSAGSQADKESLLPAIRKLAGLSGVQIYATAGTSRFLRANGVPNQEVFRISDDQQPSFASVITDEKIGMIINILTGDREYDSEKSDAAHIRRMAAERLIYLVTEVEQAITTIDTLLEPVKVGRNCNGDKTVNLWTSLASRIDEKGGFYNGHAHGDKAYTITLENFELGHSQMRQKWQLMGDIKRGPLYSSIGLEQRLRRCAESMLVQGVHTYRTFVDADTTIRLNGVHAALKIRDEYKGRLKIEVGLQPLEGLIKNEEAGRYFLEAAELGVDFIGALPSRDEERSDEHLDLVMSLAKRLGIGVDAHVDQANDPTEDESEQLARFTIKHGMQGRVTAVHSISLAAKPKEERRRIIALMKEAGLRVVVCPSAALSMEQLDHHQVPTHNSIAPVKELLDGGIPIALGTDNVEDIFMPLSTGEMMRELWMLAEAVRLYDPEILSDIACGKLFSDRVH